MVTVAGDDNLNKKEMAEITWTLDTIDVNVPDTYNVTGTIANGVTTTVKVITICITFVSRSKAAFTSA